MSPNKNLVLNAEMDDELITLLIEQVQFRMRTDRCFKKEPYNSISTAFNASNKYQKKIACQMVKNREKWIKKGYQAVS